MHIILQTNMERLVLNKWTVPVPKFSNSTSTTTTNKNAILQSTYQPKLKIIQSQVQLLKNGQMKSHKFAVPFPVPPLKSNKMKTSTTNLMTPVGSSAFQLKKCIPAAVTSKQEQLTASSHSGADRFKTSNNIIIMPTKSVSKNGKVPLPSSFKFIQSIPMVQTGQSFSNILPKTSKGIKVISSITIPGHVDKKKETSIHSNEELSKFSKSSLKPIKGRPWSWYTGKEVNDTASSVNFNNSTLPIQKNVVASSKRLIKIPSNWKLVPLPLSEIDNFSSQQSVSSKIANAESDENETSSKLIKSHQENPAAMQTKSKRLSNETSSIDTDVDWDCENDDKQPDPKKKRASYDQNDYDDPYNKILKELHKLNKKETRNAENIKAIALKMMEEEDDSESFKFPLFNKEQYEKFKHCLSRKRFTNKLIAWLEKRIINNVTKVSDLVESVFHPNLLKDFTACGLQGRDNFENTKINQIFFDICKMTYKEYHSDLTKVINKIHMRYRRHHHEYNLI